METFPYKEAVIGFSFVVYAFETYLNYRQHLKLKETERPVSIRAIIEEDVFNKSRLYGLDKSYFRFVSSLFSQIQGVALLHYNLLPILWNFSGDLNQKYFNLSLEYEISQSLTFFFLFYVVTTLIGLPLSLYQTFVLEEKHGFNKSTIGLFFSDLAKSTALVAGIGSPVLAGFLYIIKWAGKSFPFYVWSFMVVIQLLMITIFPVYIQPLFNKFSTLEEGPLKVQIEELAKSVAFPLTKLYVIDGSKRSSHSNAYFFGLFKNKRIVLYDTLLEQSTTEEILAILGHELGHWKLNHVTSRLLVGQVHLLVIFLAFQQFITNKALYDAFGFTGPNMPVFIGFVLFQYLYAPVEAVLGFLLNALSRLHEFQADAFAVELGRARPLAMGLVKLQKKNLGDMNPDPLYSAYHFSHPPLSERLAALPVTLTADDFKSEASEKKKE